MQMQVKFSPKILRGSRHASIIVHNYKFSRILYIDIKAVAVPFVRFNWSVHKTGVFECKYSNIWHRTIAPD